MAVLDASLGEPDGRLRILHVGIGNLGPGGVATYVRTAVSGLRARGHQVFLTELWPGEKSMDEVEQVLRSSRELIALIERWRPDATHLHSQLPGYGGIPTASVLTAHEHSSHCPSGGRYLAARGRECHRNFGLFPCLWGRYVDRCGSRVPSTVRSQFQLTAAAPTFPGIWIAPSRYSRDRLLDRGMSPDRLELVSNPPPENFGSLSGDRETEPVVVFLGRLVPSKGCDVLLRAMAKLPGRRLRILGDGPERKSLERLARSLGIESRTHFLGWNSPGRVEEELAKARVLAIPALWPEPFGLVALEAYATGCPVVASRIGGLLDTVIQGVTGRLVPPGDVPALAAAIGTMLDDPGLANRMGVEGHRLIQSNFRLSMHLDRLETVYSHSMAPRK